MKKENEKLPTSEEKNESGNVSRRDFLVGAGTVVVGGAIGAGLLSSCNGGGEATTVTTTKTVPTTVTTTVGGSGAVTVTETTTVGGSGAVTVTETKTVTDPGSGGTLPPALEPEQTFVTTNSLVVSYEVKNGKIIRGRPAHFDGAGDSLTITARGKSYTFPKKSLPSCFWLAYRKRINSPNRILYPLKRVDWVPGGDPAKFNPQNRGISKYKRISWDEAATLVASEVERVCKKYGPQSIWTCYGSSHPGMVAGQNSISQSFVDYYGIKNYGKPSTWSGSRATSFAGGDEGGRYFWWTPSGYEAWTPAVLQDIANNTELMLVWCGDVETNFYHAGQGGPLLHRFFSKEIGIPYVAINPDFNLGTANFATKWIPIMPQTDCAAFLAIAYTWLKEGTYDKDYLATHAVGFEKWTPYVLGDEDGIPKTPAWAAPLCGITEWTIKAIAREWAAHATSITYGLGAGGVARGPYATEAQRTQLYLMGMQAYGKPGTHQLRNHGVNLGRSAKNPVVGSYRADTKIREAIKAQFGKTLSMQDTDRQFMPKNLFDDAILHPELLPIVFWGYDNPLYQNQYPKPGSEKVHMMWQGDSTWMSSRGKSLEKLKAHQSPELECIVYQNMWFEEGCSYADIVLPITVMNEVDDISACTNTAPYTSLMVRKKVTPPVGEAKTDFATVCEVAKKLDCLEGITEGLGHDAVCEKWIKEAYEKSGWKDIVSWEELVEKGYHHEPIDPAPFAATCASYNFYQDPVKNPMGTPSGKLEYESQELLEYRPDDKERLPIARWVRGGPKEEGWTHDEDYLISKKAKDYPLVVIGASNRFGYHSQHMDIPWTREVRFIWCEDGHAYSPLWIHPEDAAKRGIKDKDVVKTFNDRGAVLWAAYVTEEVRPGTVYTDQGGGGTDMIIPTELNRGGCVNMISPAIISKTAICPCHSGFLCEVAKVTGAEWDEWHKNYAYAFERDYDPQYGLLLSAFIEKEDKA